jgi:hypothetical protein
MYLLTDRDCQRLLNFWPLHADMKRRRARWLHTRRESVFGGMVVPGDAAATARNILASEGLFRLGIAVDVRVFGYYGIVFPAQSCCP